MRKEDLLKTLKENQELLKDLLQENPELRLLIKQVLKTPKEKSLLNKLERWGIKKEEIPKEYLEALPIIESFLNWVDESLKTKTAGKKGLNFSIRPITKKEDQKEQEEQEE